MDLGRDLGRGDARAGLGSLASFGGPAVPGLTATALCLLNLLFVKRWLPESSTAEARAEAKQEQRASLGKRMLDVFTHPQRPVARLIWIYAVGMMAFMGMNAVLALFLQQRFGITEKSFGLIYAFVGSISLVMRSLLLGPAVRRFGETGVMRLGLLALAAGYAAQALAPTLITFGAAIMLIPIGTALCRMIPGAGSGNGSAPAGDVCPTAALGAAFLAGFLAAFFAPAFLAGFLAEARFFDAFLAVLPAAFLVVLVFFAAFFLAAIGNPSCIGHRHLPGDQVTSTCGEMHVLYGHVR